MYQIPGCIPKLNVTFCSRSISGSSVYCARDLYGVLGLKASATQGEIKGAYYQLSMKLHPDKNEGSKEAAEKFRAVTDAYEVLGNVRLRKLYDRGGLHHQSSGAPPPPPTREPEEPLDTDTKQRFYSAYARYRSRSRRSPSATFAGNVYDLDEWTRAHYSASFAREKEDLEHKVNMSHIHNRKTGTGVGTAILFLFLSIFAMEISLDSERKKITAMNYQSEKGNSSSE